MSIFGGKIQQQLLFRPFDPTSFHITTELYTENDDISIRNHSALLKDIASAANTHLNPQDM
jgi:hypothetical protein